MEMLNNYVLTMEHDGKKKDLIYNTNYSFLLGGTHVILGKKKNIQGHFIWYFTYTL